jgi:sugar/nucleoside kinase (ribokinase family)
MGVSRLNSSQGSTAAALLPVPQVSVRDTLGAGDIFHGAFCHYRLSANFQQSHCT